MLNAETTGVQGKSLVQVFDFEFNIKYDHLRIKKIPSGVAELGH
jgi:hypothetical protein